MPQQYCLRWKFHHNNLQTMFTELLDRGCFCDITLACEGQTLKAHRVVLCACSTYFDSILSNCSSDRETIIWMRDCKFNDVKHLVEFMYKGEINVEYTNLGSILKTAEELRIKGLTKVNWHDELSLPNEQNNNDGRQINLPVPAFNSNRQMCISAGNQSPEINSASIMNASQSVQINDASIGILGKKKRGRPPLDGEFEHYQKPSKIDRYEKVSNSQGLPHRRMESMELESQPENHYRHQEDTYLSNHNHRYMGEGLSDYRNEMGNDRNEDDGLLLPKQEVIELNDDECENEQQNENFSQVYLTANDYREWSDVVKMNDYLITGKRPQFWEESFTKRVMDAIKTKDLEMKKAAALLGVSYGTLYGRYRETYGCLKHVNKNKDFHGRSDMMGILQGSVISVTQATEYLNSSPASINVFLEQANDSRHLRETENESLPSEEGKCIEKDKQMYSSDSIEIKMEFDPSRRDFHVKNMSQLEEPMEHS